MVLTAFFDGGRTWRWRLSPDVPGAWVWESHCPGDSGLDGRSGTVMVSSDAGGRHGAVLVDPVHPQHFVYEDRAPYMLVGYEADWLWALGLEPAAAGIAAPPAARTAHSGLEGFLDHIGSFGFNHVLVSAYANYSTWNAKLPPATPPRVSPTPHTPWLAGSDWELDLRFFQNWDVVLRAMEARGLVAHIMVYVGNKGVVWPPRLGGADNAYWRYVLARYGAFSNVVWDVSKEAGSYGIGRAYVLDRLDLIGSMNAHGRLVTSHSGVEWSNECGDLPHVTMCSLQLHHPNHTGGQWYTDMVRARSANAGRPILNAEFMYEAGAQRGCNGSAAHDCVTSAADVAVMRMVMWDAYMAGGYGTWYNCDTAWDVIVTDETPAGYEAVRHLTAFLGADNVSSSWPSMQPDDSRLQVQAAGVVGHCLALENGGAFIVHERDARASFRLNASSAAAGGGANAGIASASWFDPATGARAPASPLRPFSATSPWLTFRPPASFAEDAVLHVIMQVAGSVKG